MYQALSRAGVRSVVDTRFKCCHQNLSFEDARTLLKAQPMWVIITEQVTDKNKHLLRAADLATYLNQAAENTMVQEPMIDLLAIPGRRHRALPIHQRANLYEALARFQQGAESLYIEIESPNTRSGSSILGIITESAIDNYYHVQLFNIHSIRQSCPLAANFHK